MLINRVVDTDHSWQKEWSIPQVSPQFELTLDDAPVLSAIKQLNFIQTKRKYRFVIVIIIKLINCTSELGKALLQNALMKCLKGACTVLQILFQLSIWYLKLF